MDASNYKTQRKTQAKMGRQCNTLNIKNWTACVQDRVKWKNVAEKAKTSKEKVKRLMKKKKPKIIRRFHISHTHEVMSDDETSMRET